MVGGAEGFEEVLYLGELGEAAAKEQVQHDRAPAAVIAFGRV